MPPRKQQLISDGYYHVYNRGHNKQRIFLNHKDFMRYRSRLEGYLEKHNVTLLAYCLMPTHIHLLLRQDADQEIERFMHRLHTAYTMYFNIRYDRVGSAFQGRFKAKHIESDEYLLHVSRYIHLNPIEIIRAQGPALRLEEYGWSSYQEYIGGAYTSLCDTSVILEYFDEKYRKHSKKKYKDFVEAYISSVDQEFEDSIDNGIFPAQGPALSLEETVL